MRKFGLFGAVAALLLAVLAGCYVPNQFKSEIRIGRTGGYAMTYEGELIYAPLFEEISKGGLTPKDAAEKVAAVERDLTRDPAFKEIRNLGKGRFLVKYEQQGVLDGNQLISFVRRNAPIISIKSTENGMIAVYGAAIKPSDAQRLTQVGIDMAGEFRVTTDARVLEHNASAVRAYGPYTIYIWRIDNPLSPTPKLVIARDGANLNPAKIKAN